MSLHQSEQLSTLDAPKAKGVPLSAAVLRRAGEQLNIAREAEIESELNAKSLTTNQQELVAAMAQDQAQQAFGSDALAVPESTTAFTEARKWALKAQKHADHIKQLVLEAKRIPDEAAELAAKAIENQVKKDAFAAAESANQGQAAKAAERPKMIAERVAAAAEPYHLALLRAQKESAQNAQKAQKAAQSSINLVAKAKRMAANAQTLQAEGLGMQAQQLMAMAHSTMNSAVTMKAWAEKLDASARQVGGTIGGYQFQLASAAASAAGAVGVPVVPALPPAPVAAPAAAPPGSPAA